MIALLLVPSASALAWWVADPAAVEPTRAALVELWPAGPFVLRVGAHEGYGAWYEDGRLHLDLPDGPREGPASADPAEQVLLARAWLRELPPERARLPEAPWRPQVAVLAGTGITLDEAAAPVHLAVEGAASWRSFTATGFVTADAGAIRSGTGGEAIAEQRVGGGVAAGARLPLWGGELAVVAGPTARWVLADGASTPLLGFVERLHWWRAVAPAWRFGLGVVAQYDGLGTSWLGDADDTYERPELVTAVELGMAWGRP
jgi:hypothetical protein